ncbi:hypothetical protein [Jeotgalibaca caeni]|uniref:hypothetical protein n=1 Tax=Jeotgalibaca caeni TaxID=3028623 RepID=UPI00237EA94E|nr:hypothetical protein [Jeotgalibaca caeni]MDE1548351.1 hypothetical protein [Jeotgalibaca caeni]
MMSMKKNFFFYVGVMVIAFFFILPGKVAYAIFSDTATENLGIQLVLGNMELTAQPIKNHLNITTAQDKFQNFSEINLRNTGSLYGKLAYKVEVVGAEDSYYPIQLTVGNKTFPAEINNVGYLPLDSIEISPNDQIITVKAEIKVKELPPTIKNLKVKITYLLVQINAPYEEIMFHSKKVIDHQININEKINPSEWPTTPYEYWKEGRIKYRPIINEYEINYRYEIKGWESFVSRLNGNRIVEIKEFKNFNQKNKLIYQVNVVGETEPVLYIYTEWKRRKEDIWDVITDWLIPDLRERVRANEYQLFPQLILDFNNKLPNESKITLKELRMQIHRDTYLLDPVVPIINEGNEAKNKKSLLEEITPKETSLQEIEEPKSENIEDGQVLSIFENIVDEDVTELPPSEEEKMEIPPEVVEEEVIIEVPVEVEEPEQPEPSEEPQEPPPVKEEEPIEEILEQVPDEEKENQTVEGIESNPPIEPVE